MKTYLYSNNKILYSFINEVIQHNSDIILVNDENELLGYCHKKDIIVIDINYLRDHGFCLASKIARISGRKCLIIGLCTLSVNYKNSYFDFFFNSLTQMKKNFHQIENNHCVQNNINKNPKANLGHQSQFALTS